MFGWSSETLLNVLAGWSIIIRSSLVLMLSCVSFGEFAKVLLAKLLLLRLNAMCSKSIFFGFILSVKGSTSVDLVLS